jgi:hemoglobin
MAQERTLYNQLGGMETFRRIAAAFYRQVEADDLLRPMYPEQLEEPRERFALFLAQFFGGPSDYAALRGHPRLRLRHLPFAIGQAERDRWLTHILAALDEVGIEEPARSVMTQYFASASTFLINQPTADDAAPAMTAIQEGDRP